MWAPLAFRILDRVDEARQLNSTSSVLMFTVKGSYTGYTIVSNTGLELRYEEYLDPAVARTRDGGVSRFFIALSRGTIANGPMASPRARRLGGQQSAR